MSGKNKKFDLSGNIRERSSLLNMFKPTETEPEAVPETVSNIVPQIVPEVVSETIPLMIPKTVPKNRKNQQFHLRIKRGELMEDIRIFAELEDKSINEFINDELTDCIAKKKKRGSGKK